MLKYYLQGKQIASNDYKTALNTHKMLLNAFKIVSNACKTLLNGNKTLLNAFKMPSNVIKMSLNDHKTLLNAHKMSLNDYKMSSNGNKKKRAIAKAISPVIPNFLPGGQTEFQDLSVVNVRPRNKFGETV